LPGLPPFRTPRLNCNVRRLSICDRRRFECEYRRGPAWRPGYRC